MLRSNLEKIKSNLNLTKHRHFYFQQYVKGELKTVGYLQRNTLGVVTCLLRSVDKDGNEIIWEETPRRLEQMSFGLSNPDSEYYASTDEEAVKRYSFAKKIDGEKYIIWCPTSKIPPKAVISLYGKAQEIAINMSRRYGTSFYVAKLTDFIDGDIFGNL